MKQTKRLLMIVILAGVAHAAAANLIGEKVVSFANGKGQALISSTQSEEKLGKPYSVEMRVSCSAGKVDWQKVSVADSESVCDVKSQSARLSEDGKYISVLIRETDAEDYNRRSQQVDASKLGDLKPKCVKQAKEFRFPVENYCQN